MYLDGFSNSSSAVYKVYTDLFLNLTFFLLLVWVVSKQSSDTVSNMGVESQDIRDIALEVKILDDRHMNIGSGPILNVLQVVQHAKELGAKRLTFFIPADFRIDEYEQLQASFDNFMRESGENKISYIRRKK